MLCASKSHSHHPSIILSFPPNVFLIKPLTLVVMACWWILIGEEGISDELSLYYPEVRSDNATDPLCAATPLAGGAFVKFGGRFTDLSWISRYSLGPPEENLRPDFGNIYVDALYFVMTTLSTVGYGDIVPVTLYENYFVLILLVVGSVYFGYCVGSTSALKSLILRIVEENIKNLMIMVKLRNLPRDLEFRIIK